MKLSNVKTKTAAVALAVREQIRRAKLKKLVSLLGTVTVDVEAVNEGNKADMRRAQWLKEIGDKNGCHHCPGVPASQGFSLHLR